MNRYEGELREGVNEAASGSSGPAVGANLGAAGKMGISAIGKAAGLMGYGSPELGLGLGVAGDLASGKSLGKTATNAGFSAAAAFGGMPGQVAKMGYGIATSENPTKSVLGTAGSLAGGLLAGPLGSMLGGALAGAAYGSFQEGAVGDALGSRSNERARDALEASGYSYGQASEATSGSVDARGTGGTPTETARQEMARASGFGSAAFGGYSESGSDSQGGRDNGNDTGHDGSGARGGGDEGNSSPGGIGGY